MSAAGFQLLLAACGGLVGLGVFVIGVAVAGSRPRLARDLRTVYQPVDLDGGAAGRSRAASAGRWLTDLARRHGLEQVLLADDLAIAERPVEAHTTVRLLSGLIGFGVGLMAWAVADQALGDVLSSGLLLLPPVAVLGAIVAVLLADRRVRQLARQRRAEAQAATAAFVDLVRILLAGGLPLTTALRAAVEEGSGWTFTQLGWALDWAGDRSLPPDAGLHQLAGRLPIPEFADLAATFTSARRGASPVQALESKAAFLRGGQAAAARAEAAIADAQIELPAAVIALAFMCFLMYPLLTLLTTDSGLTTGVLP